MKIQKIDIVRLHHEIRVIEDKHRSKSREVEIWNNNVRDLLNNRQEKSSEIERLKEKIKEVENWLFDNPSVKEKKYPELPPEIVNMRNNFTILLKECEEQK